MGENIGMLKVTVEQKPKPRTWYYGLTCSGCKTRWPIFADPSHGEWSAAQMTKTVKLGETIHFMCPTCMVPNYQATTTLDHFQTPKRWG